MLLNEIEDLKAGRLTLECLAMSLVSRSRESPNRFSGPGRLSLNESGRLELVLYDSSYNPDPKRLLTMFTPGCAIPDSHIYDLEATDLGGAVWKSAGLTIGVSAHVDRPGAIVRSTLQTLASEAAAERSGADWVWLFFAHRVDAPRNVVTVTTAEETDTQQRRTSTNRNVWVIKCSGVDIRMRFHESAFDVVATSQSRALSEELPAIIEESIWFTLGQPVRADVIRYRRGGREGIQIHSRGRDDTLGRAAPPHVVNAVDAAGVLSEVFAKYLERVSAERSGRYHPLSVLVRKALRAEAGTLEEMALARCVAVEGIVKLAFSEFGAPTPDTLKAVDALEELLKEPLESSPIRARIEGAFRIMKDRNSRTALHTLADKGIVGRDERLTRGKRFATQQPTGVSTTSPSTRSTTYPRGSVS